MSSLIFEFFQLFLGVKPIIEIPIQGCIEQVIGMTDEKPISIGIGLDESRSLFNASGLWQDIALWLMDHVFDKLFPLLQ